MTRDQLRNAIACDIKRREGLMSTMDYVEQLSWLLLLDSFLNITRGRTDRSKDGKE